jgi:hypothetical protein
MKVKYVKTGEISVNSDNPRIIKDGKFEKLIQSVTDLPQMLEMRPIIVDENMIILGGNMRYQACIKAGIEQIPIIQYTKKEHLDLNTDKTYEETCQEIIIKDNVGFGEWDWDILANKWNTVELSDWGLEVWQNEDDIISNEPKDVSDKIISTFKIEVDLENEAQLQKLYEKLTNENYICRILTF